MSGFYCQKSDEWLNGWRNEEEITWPLVETWNFLETSKGSVTQARRSELPRDKHNSTFFALCAVTQFDHAFDCVLYIDQEKLVWRVSLDPGLMCHGSRTAYILRKGRYNGDREGGGWRGGLHPVYSSWEVDDCGSVLFCWLLSFVSGFVFLYRWISQFIRIIKNMTFKQQGSTNKKQKI